jgi:predicted unusual protein kinase regulating ubiquinone biosynthesis (AarF/ABC1/UbiB family)
MAISLKPDHLKRYKDIAQLFIKYGRSDMVPAGSNGLDGDGLIVQEPVVSKEAEEKASQFADDLEKMGPIYVKLGQVLSSRPDILPSP